jgi:hypothetical protein
MYLGTYISRCIAKRNVSRKAKTTSIMKQREYIDNTYFYELVTECLGLVRFRGIRSGRNNKCMKKIMIWTRIYSGSKINLPIMIGRTRDRRAGLVPHLLTSGLIPSLLMYLS